METTKVKTFTNAVYAAPSTMLEEPTKDENSQRPNNIRGAEGGNSSKSKAGGKIRHKKKRSKSEPRPQRFKPKKGDDPKAFVDEFIDQFAAHPFLDVDELMDFDGKLVPPFELTPEERRAYENNEYGEGMSYY